MLLLALVLPYIPYVSEPFSPARRVEAADTITVTTTADTVAADGACSLREAITATNSNTTQNECSHNGTGGTDTINFNIVGSAPFTINVTAALPAITAPVIINGRSQPGWVSAPIIVLNGDTIAGSTTNGLLLTGGSGGSTIQGLVIQGFPNSGIRIQTNNNIIRGNYIGTNAAGTVADPNNGLDDGAGIEIVTASGNTIGGTSGLLVGNNCTGDCNLVSGNAQGNGFVGVKIRDAADGNSVIGNFVGTNVTGTSAIGNGRLGVQLINSDNNIIGGTTIAQRNVISGNDEVGVVIISYGSGGGESTGNIIRNNYIGLNSAGTGVIPGELIDWSGEAWNYSDGIRIRNSPSNTITANYISGNYGTAIRLQSYGFLVLTSGSINTDNMTVTNNFIGTNGSGTGSLGNGEHGIFLQGSSNSLIQGNVVNNNLRGIVVDHEYYDLGGPIAFIPSLNNQILQNTTSNNTNLGIDIVQRPVQSVPTFGVTVNDGNDADTGNNDQQNFPVLTSANVVSGPSLTVSGNLTTIAGTYQLQFFSSSSCDSSGNGEGATYLGSSSLVVASTGVAQPFTVTGLPSVTLGHVITTTATSNNGAAGGETSEYSGCATVTSALPTVSINDPGAVIEGTGGGSTTITYTVTLSAASGSTVTVPFSIGGTASGGGIDYTFLPVSPLSFTPGDTSENIVVTVNRDALDELDETVVVTLGAPVGANPDPNPANTIGDGSITDDDNPPTVSINDVTVNESVGTMTLTVTLSAASGLNIDVPFTSSDGTATAADYLVTTGSPLIFAAGDTSETISVTITPDALDEDDETFNVQLGAPTNATLDPIPANTLGVGTITDDDPLPTVSIDDVTVGEATSTVNFTVTLSAASGRTVTVQFADLAGTATTPADYNVVDGTVTFVPGDTSETVSATIVNDTLDEDDETFTVNLSAPTNATIADGSGLGTITDNDPLPTVSINDVTVDEADGTLGFTVTLTPVSGRTVTVPYTVANGSATSPADYTLANGSVTFVAGDTSETITATIINDLLDEDNENFTVTLGVPTNATIADGTGVGTITDNDALPTVSIDDVTVNEAAGTMNFTVTLSPVSGRTVTVPYTVANGSATSPADYTLANGSVTFIAGDTSETITATIVNDTTDEPNETFTVTLGAPTNATVDVTPGAGVGVGTITDNDNPPTISITDVALAEGTGGAPTVMNFTVNLTAVSAFTVSTEFTVADVTAVSPGDYTVSTISPVTINPGSTSVQVQALIVQDNIDEPTETFTITLVNPTNATLNSDPNEIVGVGTILDDDPTPVVSINDVAVTEGTGGTTTLNLTVSLTNPSSQNVSVTFTSANGSATGADYSVTTISPLVINAGTTTGTIAVDIVTDALDENNEAFTVTLTGATNATLDPDLPDITGVGTINDDDAPPVVSINDVSIAEGTGGTTTLNFTVTLSAVSGLNANVQFAAADVTATGADYSVTTISPIVILAGSTTGTIAVDIVTDALDEPNETFTVTLTGATNATLDPDLPDITGVGTINDDDATPTVSINDVAVTEGTGPGTTTLTYTVTLSAASGFTVSVPFTAADVTATDPADYSVTTISPLTFNPGVLTQNIAVDIVRDATDEPNETFEVTLGAPTNATVDVAPGAGVGVGTINNDDGPPLVSITDVTANEGAGTLTFTVSLTAASGLTVTVPFTSAAGTALTPADYSVATISPLTFTPGDTSETITVNLVNDLLDENDETFTVTLGTPTNADLDPTPGNEIGTGTITDNDNPPTVSIDDVAVTEGTGAGTTTLTFTATLSAPSGLTITVPFISANGTAGGADYSVTTVSPLTFNAGVTTQTISVNIVRDALDENNEDFTVTLGAPTNATLDAVVANTIGVGTINDDDNPPSVSIDDVAVTEGTGAGTTTLTFTATLSAPSGLTITVPFTAADVTATVADYSVTTISPLTFNAGVTTQTISVNIVRDATDEPNETFEVTLGAPTNATLDGTVANTIGVGTINDDDAAPTVSIDDVAVVEGTGGTTTLTFTATLSAASGLTVTVPFTSANGTATGADYSVTTVSPLTFNVGVTTQTIAVDIVTDNIDENNETFTVTLGAPTNATLDPTPGAGVGIGTINDDDNAPVVSINDGAVTEGTGGTNTLTFTVSLTNPSSFVVTVPFTSANGTASSTDYSVTTISPLTFNAGVTSQSISVNIVTDAIDENNEDFTVTLGAPTNATLDLTPANTIGVGTINDDDAPPTVSIDDVAVTEGTGVGTTNLTFTVTLSAASDFPITVPFTVADVTAVTPADYSVTTISPLNFVAGTTTRTIVVSVVRDGVDENNETFNVTLGAPTNATLDPTPANTVGVGTINDDDTAGVTVTITGANTTVVESPAPSVAQRDTFDVRLASEPTGNVTISLTVSDGQTLIGRVGGPYGTTLNLTFVPSGTPTAPNTLWDVAQTVEVVAVDDALVEPAIHNGAINFAVQAGSAAEYVGLSIPALSVRIQDNDGPEALAIFNPQTSQASLLNTLQDLPPSGAYNTFAPGAPLPGQWVMGDWDGDGQKTPGVYASGAFFYTNLVGPVPPASWVGIWFGLPGPAVPGRFDAGVGHDCIGVVDSGNFPPYGTAYVLYYTCNLTSGPTPPLSFQWLSVVLPDSQGFTGTAQFTAGDWDGNGTDSIAIRRSEFIAYTNVPPAPNAPSLPYSLATFDLAQYIGDPRTLAGDVLAGQYGNMVSGDWDSDGIDSFGLYYPAGYFYYRNDLLWNSGVYTLQRVAQPIGTTTVATSWRAGVSGGAMVAQGQGEAVESTPTPSAPTTRRITTVIESDDAQVVREGKWTVQTAPLASGERYVYGSGSTDDILTLEFVGTSVEVIYVESRMTGTFTIVVDDVAVRTVITTGDATEFNSRTLINYLSDGQHTLQIVPISGTVAVDAFVVTQETTE